MTKILFYTVMILCTINLWATGDYNLTIDYGSKFIKYDDSRTVVIDFTSDHRVVLDITVSDPEGHETSIYYGWFDGSRSFTHTVNTRGTYTIKCESEVYGMLGQESFKLYVDRDPPHINISSDIPSGQLVNQEAFSGSPKARLTSITDGSGVHESSAVGCSGVAEKYWEITNKNGNIHREYFDEIDLSPSYSSVMFYAVDNVGNSVTETIIINADILAPSISSLSNFNTTAASPTWKSSNTTLTTVVTDVGCGLKNYYWIVNGVHQAKSKSVTLSSGNNIVHFYAEDKIGNTNNSSPTYYVNIDKTNPSTPISPKYKSIIGALSDRKVVFSWSGGSDNGGSGINTNALFVDYGTGVYSQASTNVNSDLEVLLSSHYGKELKLKSKSIDNVSRVSIDNNEITFKIPHKMDIASGSDNNVVVSQTSYLPTYNVNLKLSYDDGLNFTDGSYDVVVNFTDKNGVTQSFVYPITAVVDKTFSFSFSGTGFDKRNATFKLRTKLKNVVINESTINMTLDKYGSDVNLSVKNNLEFINEAPTVILNENYSNVGYDIDGNEVKYNFKITKPNNTPYDVFGLSFSTNVPSTEIDFNNVTDNSENKIFINNGEYKIKLNPLNGSSELSVFYETSSPAITNIVPNKDRTNNVLMDIAVGGITDTGGSGLDKLVLECYDYGSSTVNYTYTYDPDIDSFVTPKIFLDAKVANVNSNTSKKVTLKATAYDNAGNVSETKHYEITVDKELPVITTIGVDQKYYIPDSDSLDFLWSTENLLNDSTNTEDHSYAEIDFSDPDIIDVSSLLTTSYTLSSLSANQTVTATLAVYDEAGNKSLEEVIDGCTLESIDSVTSSAFSQREDGVDKFISLKFQTTEAKYDRYSLEAIDVTDTLYTPTITKTSEIVDGDFYCVFSIPYTKLNEITFKLIVENDLGDENYTQVFDDETPMVYTPNNFNPYFKDTSSLDMGFVNTTNNSIVWGMAYDPEGDPVNYTVEITGPDNYLMTLPGIDETTLPLGSIGLVDTSLYSFSVSVTDGIITNEIVSNGQIDIISGSFTVDDTPSTILESINKTNTYTNNFTVTINDIDASLNSGLKSVNIINKTTGDILFTNDDYLSDTFTAAYLYNYDSFNTGDYNIEVVVVDVAGNSTTGNFDIIIDNNNPVAGDLVFGYGIDGIEYINNNSIISATLDVSDIKSGVMDVEYSFYETDSTTDLIWTSLNGNMNIISSLSYSLSVNYPFEDGTSNYLFVRLKDRSGLYSDPLISDKPIYTDTSAPLYVSSSLSGYKDFVSENYVEDLSLFTVSSTFSDTEESSDAIITKTYLTNSDEDIVLDSNTLLTEGSLYNVIVEGTNKSELSTRNIISSFVYDNNAPYNGIILLESQSSFIAGENIKINISVKDDGSGIKKSRLSITGLSLLGSTNNEVIIDSGWSQSDNVFTNSYNIQIPENTIDGEYTVLVIFEDDSGKETSITDSFIVDNFITTVDVDVTPFTGISNENNAKILFNGDEISTIDYKINNGDWNSLNSETDINDLLEFTFYDELLVETDYALSIKIVTVLGDIYNATSDIFIYDDSAPVNIAEDSDIFPLYSTSSSLNIRWDIYDIESGVSEIKHRVEKLVKNDEELQWEKVEDWKTSPISGNTGNYVFNRLEISTGDRVRVKQRVINYAGLITERISPEITIDNTIESRLTNIVDNARYMKTTSTPVVNLVFTENDMESGMTYYWAYSNNISTESVTTWNPIALNIKEISVDPISISPNNGETWYFLVKGINGVGLETYGVSNGITYDDTAPDIATVNLVEEIEGIDDEFNVLYYITSLDNLHLKIDAEDNNATDLHYIADYGKHDIDGNYLLLSEVGLIEGGTNPIDLSLIDFNNASDFVVFRGEVYDKAGNKSDVGYSPGAKLDSTNPSIFDITSYISDNKLYVGWNSTAGGSPIKEYTVTLFDSNNNPIKTSAVTDRKYILNLSELTDDIYSLNVTATSYSRLYSLELEANGIVVDNTAPEITENNVFPYVHKLIQSEINYIEEGVGVEELNYCIGTATDPDLITGGWKSTDVNFRFIEVDLLDYLTNYENLLNGTTIYFTISLTDRAGNVSSQVRSNGLILDKTLAEGCSISIPGFNYSVITTKSDESGILDKVYSSYTNIINNIAVSGYDEESGLFGINLIRYKKVDGSWVKENSYFKEIGDLDLTNNKLQSSITELVDFTLNYDDDFDYRLGLKIINNTNTPSSEVYSEVVHKDFTDPSNLFNDDILIFNNNKTVIDYSLSEYASIDFILTNTTKNVIQLRSVSEGIDMTGGYLFDHKYNGEEDAYGNYRLDATLTDLAGNISQFSKDIRYNEPPRIKFINSDYFTTPGQLFQIVPKYVRDNDGDLPLAYSWKFFAGDNSDKSLDSTANPVVKFYHDVVTSDETRYEVELTVTDNNGKSTTKSHFVTVKNTSSGPLYTDEFWMDTHNVYGDVFVGKDQTLTINPGTIEQPTTINVFNNSSISISGLLVSNSNTLFKKGDEHSELWKGLIVENSGNGLLGGKAEISGSTIRDAIRGVTVIGSGSLAITDSIITNNVIGIHAFECNPTITNTVINNNSAYGIKEDGICSPVLTGISYSGNTIDYYETGKNGTDTILVDLEGIN